MDKFCIRLLLISLALFSIAACTSVVEPVQLPSIKSDPSLQENFNIKFLPLNFKVAQELNSQIYSRLVSNPGNAYSADVLNEASIATDKLPINPAKFIYKLGIGDQINLIQTIDSSNLVTSPFPSLEQSGPQTQKFNSLTTDQVLTKTNQTTNIISTSARVASDGSVLLIGVGRLQAEHREISELRDEVRSILIRNGQNPNFQLEIATFNSQKVFITTDLPSDQVISLNKYVYPITDKGITLREVIASVGIAFNQSILTVITLKRGGNSYSITLNDLLSNSAQNVYLTDEDHIFIRNLNYVDGKVFLLGGVVPSVISIKPEERQTLAEVLFAKGGPLAEPSAQRSAVYLLRGTDPLYAYHLDVQNPARILVADSVELRPNDIVFVGEQPISIFNRVLSTILPLRMFSRDAKNNDLP